MNEERVARELLRVARELVSADKVDEGLERLGNKVLKGLKKKGVEVLRAETRSYADEDMFRIRLRGGGSVWMSKEGDEHTVAVNPVNFAANKYLTLRKLPTAREVVRFLDGLKKSPEHAEWYRFIGYLERSEAFDKDALGALARKHLRWFELEEEDDDMMMWSTREHGDVGSETPGSADVRAAWGFAKAVRREFPDYAADVEEVDEWVSVTVSR